MPTTKAKLDTSAPLPSNITIDDKYGPAMAITDANEAAAYFERCVEHLMARGHSRAEAERIERSNIGYFAGYYDAATMERVGRLFGAAHPVFGATLPSAEEAYGSGRHAGEKP